MFFVARLIERNSHIEDVNEPNQRNYDNYSAQQVHASAMRNAASLRGTATGRESVRHMRIPKGTSTTLTLHRN